MRQREANLRPQLRELRIESQHLHADIGFIALGHEDVVEAVRSPRAIRRRQRDGALAGQPEYVVAISITALAHRFPLADHRDQLATVPARRFLAPGTRFVDLRELRGDFAVLPVRPVPLPRYGDTHRDHVGVRGAALLEHDLPCPVGAPVRLRKPGVDVGDRLLPGERLQVGVATQMGIDGARIDIERGDVGEWSELGCFIRHPARQCVLRDTDSSGGFACTVLEHCDSTSRGDQVSRGSPAGAEESFAGFDLHLRQANLLGDLAQGGFGVKAIEPGKGGVTFDRCGDCALFRQRLFRFALEPLAAQGTLLRTRDFLRDTDPAHCHEVARDAEAIRSFYRQVVDADPDDRIRQLAGSDTHLACGNDARVLRAQQLRALQCDALRVAQRQGAHRPCVNGLGRRRQRRRQQHASRRKYGRQDISFGNDGQHEDLLSMTTTPRRGRLRSGQEIRCGNSSALWTWEGSCCASTVQSANRAGKSPATRDTPTQPATCSPTLAEPWAPARGRRSGRPAMNVEGRAADCRDRSATASSMRHRNRSSLPLWSLRFSAVMDTHRTRLPVASRASQTGGRTRPSEDASSASSTNAWGEGSGQPWI